jgi:hypothetical protein
LSGLFPRVRAVIGFLVVRLIIGHTTRRQWGIRQQRCHSHFTSASGPQGRPIIDAI